MISWFARNDVAANLLMVSIVLGGLFALNQQVKFEVFPSSDPEVISVTVPLRGATPEDAELGIAARIEEAIFDLEGIDEITSTSVEGSASVRIEVDQDYDPKQILNEVKSRVDAINTFPADTEKPVISLAQFTRDVITVAVAGNFTETELRNYAEQVRDDLLRQPGITQVSLDSVRRYEISIEASQDRLREFDLSLRDVANAISASSLDLSAGNIKTDGGDILIRSKGQAYRQNEFESIVVKTNPDGSIVRVSDVAVVNDGFEEAPLRTGFNGEPAALIEVFRVSNQNAIDVADAVKSYIDQKQDTLPVGMTLSYWSDTSQILKTRLGTLTQNAVQGAILVIVLLTLFLRPAIALWVFIGIPISFLGAFMLMAVFGTSINIMSVFAFIVVLGIVVDDAIVTGENVYTHLRSGAEGIDAAIAGTKEVAIPVTFGVLTTITAFVPIAFIEGRLGNFFSSIPAVVIPVLLFSLVESKLILPAHLKHIRLTRNASDEKHQNWFKRWQANFANGFEQWVERRYQPVLKTALEYRYSVLAGFIGVFVLTIALISSGWTRFVFFPVIESDFATVNLTMPVGTPFEVTDRNMQRLNEAILTLRDEHIDEVTGKPVVKNILYTSGSTWGSSGSHIGRIRVETIPHDQRPGGITTTELTNQWRKLVGEIPGAESVTFRSFLFRSGDPINIQFSATSLETLAEVADQVKARLAGYPNVFDIADSLSDGKEELRIELNQQGHVLGLTRSDILSQVSAAFRGFEAQRIQRGRDDVRVIVRLPEQERRVMSTLGEYLITTPDGRQVPLAHVATLIPDKGPSEIRRINRYRVVNITADVDKQKTNMLALADDLTGYIDELLLQYPGVSYVLEGESRQQRESFQSLGIGLVITLFTIYCLLALPLKSYVQPLVVMSVIPFGMIGAVIGHWIMGYNVSLFSFLGVMALTGIVVNDSLVLVNYINQQRARQVGTREAVLKAGLARFRPVMLTSITTFFGLLPLLFETSVQAGFLIPMAISLGFGILFATSITLILIPVNITVLEDLKRLVSMRSGQSREPNAARLGTEL